jgi:hypothetical protein
MPEKFSCIDAVLTFLLAGFFGVILGLLIAKVRK